MSVALAVLAVLIQACFISATDVCAQQAKSDPTPNCNAIHLPGLHEVVPGGKPYIIRWDVGNSGLLTTWFTEVDIPSLEQYWFVRLPCPLPGPLHGYSRDWLHRRPRP